MPLILSTHPTLGSSIHRYITALVLSLQEHPQIADAPEAAVSDGYPARDLAATHLITVGGQPEPTADGTQSAAALGPHRPREEEYRVQVYCSAQVGGTDQALARGQAFALLRVVEEVLQRDPQMARGGAPIVRVSQLDGAIVLSQTSGDGETAVKGRWAEVAAQIQVRNRVQVEE